MCQGQPVRDFGTNPSNWDMGNKDTRTSSKRSFLCPKVSFRSLESGHLTNHIIRTLAHSRMSGFEVSSFQDVLIRRIVYIHVQLSSVVVVLLK